MWGSTVATIDGFCIAKHPVTVVFIIDLIQLPAFDFALQTISSKNVCLCVCMTILVSIVEYGVSSMNE